METEESDKIIKRLNKWKEQGEIEHQRARNKVFQKR